MFGSKVLKWLAQRKTLPGELPPLFSGEVRAKGEIFAEGDGQIDVDFEGNVVSTAVLGVGPKGKVRGDLKGQDIQLAGDYEGEFEAQEHISIKKGCRVRARGKGNSLQVEAGSGFEGLLAIGHKPGDVSPQWKLKA